MLEYRLGYFARALCGHDKDRLYMIVSENGEMLGLCDGIHRKVNQPKMKKKKHVQLMRSEKMAEAFSTIMASRDADRIIAEEIQKRDKRNEKAGGL